MYKIQGKLEIANTAATSQQKQIEELEQAIVTAKSERIESASIHIPTYTRADTFCSCCIRIPEEMP